MFRKKRNNLLMIALTLFLITGCTRCDDGGKTPDKPPLSIPGRISITAVSASEVKISWQPSAGTGVKGYKIYRNGQYLKSTEALSFSDTGLQANIKYCYKVSAYDGAGNESVQSTDVCAVL